MKSRLTTAGQLRCLIARARELARHYQAQGKTGLALTHAVAGERYAHRLAALTGGAA